MQEDILENKTKNPQPDKEYTQSSRERRILIAKNLLRDALDDDRNRMILGYGPLADIVRDAVLSNVKIANYCQFQIEALTRGIEPDDYRIIGSANPKNIVNMFGSDSDDIIVASYRHEPIRGIQQVNNDTEPSYNRSVVLWRKSGLSDYVNPERT